MRKRRRFQETNNASTGATTAASSTSTDNSIPGFYYDPERRRYFRILAEQHGAGGSGYVTPQTVKQRRREEQRQQLLVNPQVSTKTAKPKTERASVLSILTKRQLGLVPQTSLQRSISESRVRFLDKDAVRVQKPSPLLKRIGYLQAAEDGRSIFGWGDLDERRGDSLIEMCVHTTPDGQITTANFEYYLQSSGMAGLLGLEKITDMHSVDLGDRSGYLYSSALGSMGSDTSGVVGMVSDRLVSHRRYVRPSCSELTSMLDIAFLSGIIAPGISLRSPGRAPGVHDASGSALGWKKKL